MSNIPGLSLLPVENGDENAIQIPSFTDTVAIPESHKHGNCRRIGEFIKVSKITKGKFFDMYLCRNKRTNEVQYLKKFKMDANLQNGVPKEILREFNILNSLNHVNVVKSHGPVAASSLENNYLILDYCRFSLKDLINKKFPIYEKAVVKCIIQQLFHGLHYIHSALVLHRDINSENIVFDSEGILKITGFHFSCFDNRALSTPAQTDKRYHAPELLLYSETKTYDSKVDMWAAGCVVAELGLKKPIFTGDNEIEVLDSIFKILGTPSEKIWPGFEELFALIYDNKRVIFEHMPYSYLYEHITETTTPCLDIITNLLLYSSKFRYSAKECLESSYFKENPTACSAQHLASILKEPAKTPVTSTV